jgi:hypothetical protein
VSSEGMYIRRITIWSAMPIIQLLLGLWLLASPYFLQYTIYSDPRMNVGLVAPMVIMFALMRMAVSPPWFWVGWINVLFGIWLAISPFAFGLGHVTALMLNFVLVGLLLVVTGVLGQFEKEEMNPEHPSQR